MNELQQQIITHMRTAIATFKTDTYASSDAKKLADELARSDEMEWSDDFAALYNETLAIWRACTPQQRGRYTTTHREIGYSSFHTTVWREDKVQPSVDFDALLVRFDELVR
jgi:hypothetical protein